MTAASRMTEREAHTVDAEVVDTVRSIDDDDVVVVNDDGRTWLVTDTVERRLSGDETPRERKWAVRLQSHRGEDASTATAALVLVAFTDHYEAALHILDGKDRIEDGQVYALEHVAILDPDPSWVVVQRAGHSTVFHFPAVRPASRGEALPACGGQPGPVDPSEYRIVSRTVVPGLTVCRDCARRQRPRAFETVTCPACGRNLTSGVLQGPRVAGVTGLQVDCPEADCSYSGIVDLPELSVGDHGNGEGGV
ncbi:hypothetical protein [Halobacterium salinarum]|uniref:hypothetical protein n=1 Tax=Halobacterium salinarum TaxID=2242 RepID=UPI0025564B96|nr:hypothetical protein [Halobacterium salinarum]MDL0126606.1 hypothetical protein [Halobacterium salinarum]